MRRPRGKTIALITVGVGITVLAIAGFAMKDVAVEWWYLKKLDSDDVRERENAAIILGEMQSINAVPVLFKNFTDSGVKISVSYPDNSQLSSFDPALIPKSFAEVYCYTCLKSIVRIGKPAVPHLKRSLNNDDPVVRRCAADILGLIGYSAISATPELLALKNNQLEKDDVRYSAAVAIMKIEGSWLKR